MGFWDVRNEGAVAVATFGRPPRNLMSMAAMTELEGVLTALADDESVNVVVLASSTPGYFVAHADLDDLIALGSGQEVVGDPGSWGRTLPLMESMRQPVIAAIAGQAWGGGNELAMAATIRLASESAHFGQPEISVGIIPGAGGTQRLSRLVGVGRAAELVLTGDIIDAHEALRIGLVNKVLPDNGPDDTAFDDAVLAYAQAIAAKSPMAAKAGKKAVLEGAKLSLEDGLELESQLFFECQTQPDTLETQRVVAAAESAAPADQPFHL